MPNPLIDDKKSGEKSPLLASTERSAGTVSRVEPKATPSRSAGRTPGRLLSALGAAAHTTAPAEERGTELTPIRSTTRAEGSTTRTNHTSDAIINVHPYMAPRLADSSINSDTGPVGEADIFGGSLGATAVTLEAGPAAPAMTPVAAAVQRSFASKVIHALPSLPIMAASLIIAAAYFMQTVGGVTEEFLDAMNPWGVLALGLACAAASSIANYRVAAQSLRKLPEAIPDISGKTPLAAAGALSVFGAGTYAALQLAGPGSMPMYTGVKWSELEISLLVYKLFSYSAAEKFDSNFLSSATSVVAHGSFAFNAIFFATGLIDFAKNRLLKDTPDNMADRLEGLNARQLQEAIAKIEEINELKAALRSAKRLEQPLIVDPTLANAQIVQIEDQEKELKRLHEEYISWVKSQNTNLFSLNWGDNWRHNAALMASTSANIIFCIATATSLQEGAEKTPDFYRQYIFLALRAATNEYVAMGLMIAACFIYNSLGARGLMQLGRVFEAMTVGPGDYRDKLIKAASMLVFGVYIFGTVFTSILQASGSSDDPASNWLNQNYISLACVIMTAASINGGCSLGFLEAISSGIERLCHKLGSDLVVTPWPHAREQALLKDAKVEASRENTPRTATIVAGMGTGSDGSSTDLNEPLLDSAA